MDNITKDNCKYCGNVIETIFNEPKKESVECNGNNIICDECYYAIEVITKFNDKTLGRVIQNSKEDKILCSYTLGIWQQYCNTFEDLIELQIDFLKGDRYCTIYHIGPIYDDTKKKSDVLIKINQKGFITTNSQTGCGENDDSSEYTDKCGNGYLTGFMDKKYISTFHLRRIALIFSGVILSKTAWADSSESPVGEGLSYFINTVVYGTDGVVIATIAIAGVGIACFKGALEWKYLFYTVGGISIVFGAPAIVQGVKSLVHAS